MAPEQFIQDLAAHIQRLVTYQQYHLLIAGNPSSHSDYSALARIIRAGFFSTIITLQQHTFLKDALDVLDHSYRVLIPGRGQDDHVAAALEGMMKGTSIVKWYANEDVISDEQRKDIHLSLELQRALERYLKHGLIIIGSVEHEPVIARALFAHDGRDNIYYILPVPPQQHDPVVSILRRQRKPLEHFLLAGAYGGLSTFFTHLEHLLHKDNWSRNMQSAGSIFVLTPPTVVPLPPLPVIPSRFSSVTTVPLEKEQTAVELYEVAPTLSSPLPVVESARADVLLVTVTDIEARAVLDCFPSYASISLQGRPYYDLGKTGGAHVFMAQSAGAGPMAAGYCIEDAMKALAPRIVMMVGIAFGFRPDRQQDGDILVSAQIEDYDSQKIATGPDGQMIILARGERIGVPERLKRFFSSARHRWPATPAIHDGLILSGSKLIDHQGFRDMLLQISPEAIGGEMEGMALCSVCRRYYADWMLIKAISDWADGHKGEHKELRQREAAANAARFALSIIAQDGFVPHSYS